MQADWDQRAKANALGFVNNAKEKWGLDEFFETGEINLRNQVLNRLDEICGGKDPASMRVLEIGCGVGRMTRALAKVFGEVHGVDVSGEMITRAKELLSDLPNVYFHRNSGLDLEVLTPPFDFVFSFIVFQHIPSRRVIQGYFLEVDRVLRPGCLFVFQVAVKPAIQSQVMSFIINLSFHNTWVGVFLSERDVQEMAKRAGFELRRVERSSEAELWVSLRKPIETILKDGIASKSQPYKA